jgi:hypothetical protein
MGALTANPANREQVTASGLARLAGLALALPRIHNSILPSNSVATPDVFRSWSHSPDESVAAYTARLGIKDRSWRITFLLKSRHGHANHRTGAHVNAGEMLLSALCCTMPVHASPFTALLKEAYANPEMVCEMARKPVRELVP